ncbi:hypothetical protein FH972_007801 [Carpinus fangiana]|uniref:EGF-like domain-containing protein n=1 Tax=Carpinus fangiana TaxID=176857 RepID=A0A5N6QZE8_9ROSI|nr:hypothetical protein FH972_007801 [Carpinus fangiana]
MHILNYVGEDCYDRLGGLVHIYYSWLRADQYTISNSKNKFTVLGCDTHAYLSGYQNGEWYSTGCSSQCPSLNNVVNGSCSGVGCCEVGFPDGLKDIAVEVYSFNNHTKVWNFNPCGYAFVVEKGEFNFSVDNLKDLRPNKTVPLVLDWAVGNLTCDEARNKPNFACQENSECLDPQNRQGYRCKCKQGYRGNPYLHGGCQDIDECKDSKLNNCTKICANVEGNYTCSCPEGYHGDGRRDGEGCVADPAQLAIKIPIVIGVSFVAMLVGSSWLYFVHKKRKLIKLKERFFRQNGGLILQQQLRKQQRPRETAKIFNVEELKKATNNYEESKIIGQGGFGTVYKGFLPDKRIVAIKKSEKERSLAMFFLSSLKEDRLFEVLENRIVEGGNEEQIKEVVELAKRCLREKGDERPTMKEVAIELDGIRKTETHLWVSVQSNVEEAEHLLGETSHAFKYSGSNSRAAGYDSMNDHESLALGDGR